LDDGKRTEGWYWKSVVEKEKGTDRVGKDGFKDIHPSGERER
jgi:hypothetical protein